MYSPACADPQCTNPHALTRNVLTRNVGAHKVLTRNAMTKPTDPHVLTRNVLTRTVLARMLPAVPTRGPRYPTQHNVMYCICSQSISTDNHAYVASTYDMGH